MIINHWYIASESEKLKNNPLSCKVLEEPIVLFRNSNNEVSALLNRCPHRNVYLSKGKIKNGNIQCPYHGWEFNNKGECVKVPSLCNDQKIPVNSSVKKFPVVEQDDYIWVWIGDREPEENEKPFKIPNYKSNGWGNKRFSVEINNDIDNITENFIDTTHTGYIHKGLFRNEAEHIAKTHLKIVEDGVIIDIEEEETSNSILGRLLLGDSKPIHQDRFIMPSIVQVSYSFGEYRKMSTSHILTPIEKNKTKIYLIFSYKFGFMNPLLSILSPTFSKLIIEQDKDILNHQGNITKYGEKYASVISDTANIWVRNFKQKSINGLKEDFKIKDINFKL